MKLKKCNRFIANVAALFGFFVCSAAYAEPCLDLYNLRMLFAKPKLEAATLLRMQAENQFAEQQKEVEQAELEVDGQETTLESLSQQKDNLSQDASSQEALLKSVLQSIKRNKKKKKSTKSLKRKRNQINDALIDIQGQVHGADNSVFSAQLTLMTLRGQASIASLELEEQRELVAEALAQEQKYKAEINLIEQEYGKCLAP